MAMRPQILILDDFKVSNEIMAGLLNEIGYQTHSCQSSYEAIEFIKTTKIDVIITDYYMPGVNGIDFLKMVRELPGCQSIPVIFLSSTDDSEIISNASNYKINGWLKKPVDINRLTEVINKVITQ